MSALVVAYALTKYAQPSQTFIDLEIAELRRTGVTVHIVSAERGGEVRDDATYLDAAPTSPATHLRFLAVHPARYARFLARALALRKDMGAAPELVPWWRLPAVALRLERAGVQVVHAHFGWSGASLAALLGALLDVRWSMTLHAKDIFAKRRSLDRKLALADAVVTVSDDNRRWLDQHHRRTRRPIEVITCGVEVPAALPAQRTGADVVAVARLIRKKGLDVLVRSVAQLRDRGVSVRTEIGGDGPELEPLRQLVDELGLAELVTLPGALPHAEALDRIAAARVFCLPCRVAEDGDRDAMPTVIIEAMMRGVPVVSTAVVGIPEMVDETVGRLVPPDDPTALADALGELLGDDVLLQRLGPAAAVRARERFTVQGQAGRLAALLTELAQP